MKLLIVTQTIDREDPALGFFHRWVEEFAKHCERVEVVCLKEGQYVLPENVRVHSLGKEKGGVSRFTYSARFVSLIWKLRKGYDSVFVHMNPEYIVLGGVMWKSLRKPVHLWYTHKSTPWYLRVALPFTKVVFTASVESFRLRSAKVNIMGHGIDVPASPVAHHSDGTKLISIGRISTSKGLHVLIDAFLALKKDIKPSLTLVGVPATAVDVSYEKGLQEKLQQAGIAHTEVFVGPRMHADIPALLESADYFLHASETGSLDKSVLEAAAYGAIPFTSSEAYAKLLEGYTEYLSFPKGDSVGLAARIQTLQDMPEEIRITMRSGLYQRVQKDHSLQSLIPRLLSILQK